MKDGTLWIIGAIILFLAWQSGIFTDLFAIVPIQTNQFTSYTNIVREGSQCDIPSFWTNNNLISSPTAIIPTLSSNFKFETTTHFTKPIYGCQQVPAQTSTIKNVQPTFIDEDGCQHWSYDIYSRPYYISWSSNVWPDYTYCLDPYFYTEGGAGDTKVCYTPSNPGFYGGKFWIYHAGTFQNTLDDVGGQIQIGSDDGCFYSAKIYKDNVLIDEIDITGSSLFKSYSDDGNVYDYDLPTDKSGLEVEFGSQLFYTPACITSFECQIKHYYRMYLLSDDITIDVSSPQEVYIEGEIVEISVDVINNFDTSLLGTLEIKYEVPTIIGPKESIEIYEGLNINPGSNTFTYIIPTEIRTERLDVTPTIKIYQPTSIYSGINVLQGFEEFGTERGPITAHPQIRVYTFTGNTETIRIKSEAESLREQLDLLQDDIVALQALLDTKVAILKELELTLQEQLDIIESYELLIEEKAYLISQLELELNEQAIMVNELTINLQEKAYLVSQLQVENEKQAQLIAEMNLSFSDQADIIILLNKEIEDDAEIIANLGLSLEQEAQVIANFELTIEEQDILISKLGLSLEQEQELVNLLTLIIEEQEKEFDWNEFLGAYKIFIIAGGIIFVVLLFGGKRR